jgi:PPM family protein phosphatase
MRFAHALELHVGTAGQDRAVVIERPESLVIALADGAGGTGAGAEAAQAVIDAARTVSPSPSIDWAALLASLDASPARLAHGQTTAVVLTLSRAGISGASVGDSGAWLITPSDIVDLTESQYRKPLLGAGATHVPFSSGALGAATLLVASDGLLRYAPPRAIADLARGRDLGAAARALVALVRLPSGGLPDDVSLILCRER